MLSFLSPASLAGPGIRHPWRVIGVWVAVLIAAGILAAPINSLLTTEITVFQDFEAEHARELVGERMRGGEPGDEVVVIHSDSAAVDDPAFEQLVNDVVADLRAQEREIAVATNYYELGPAGAGLVSGSGQSLIIPVVYSGVDLPGELAHAVLDVTERYNGQDGFTVVAGGDGSIDNALVHASEKDLQTSEIFGIPIAMVVLVFVFGALVAAGMPLMVAAAGIFLAIGIASIVARGYDLSIFAMNIIIGLGLAVGIDYSLLIVQRFREERANGLPVDAAILRTASTASRAVLFSGLAVIVALSALFLTPDSVFRSLSIGAIAVVLAVVAAALTLLPAVLRLVGDHVNRIAIPLPGAGNASGQGGPVWSRVAHFVMDHPVICAATVSIGLVALGSLYTLMNIGQARLSTLPADSEARQAFALLEEEFSAGAISPVEIVVDGAADDPALLAAIDDLSASLANDAELGPPTPEVGPNNDITLLSIPFRVHPESSAAEDAVSRIRDTYVPEAFAGVDAEVFVGGTTAFSMDYSDMINSYTPIVLAFVLGLSFIILLVVFRSIVVPIKAIIMNLLSVGAAYGLMVLVFQEGFLAGFFGYTQVERIESWVPLFMFAVLFGLSMDYHVFLLTRIREHYDHSHNNREAVASGVRATAGLITGAAAIMVAVFGAISAGQMLMFQQMGFGLAIAVLLDATVIRVVLVPASMALLGDWNWYLPSWLQWIPRVDIEGATMPVDELVEEAAAPVSGAS